MRPRWEDGTPRGCRAFRSTDRMEVRLVEQGSFSQTCKQLVTKHLSFLLKSKIRCYSALAPLTLDHLRRLYFLIRAQM